MNKFNVYIVLLCISIVLLSGCKKFLTEKPSDQLPEDDAYATTSLVFINTVANLYTMVGATEGGEGIAGRGDCVYDMVTLSADECLLPTRGGDWYDGGKHIQMFEHKWNNSIALMKNPWDYLYKVVATSNQSVDKLTELIQEDPTNVDFPKYLAEVRAFRAMYYYYLLDLYGRVPILTTAKVAITDVKQSERKEVFDFAVKELQETLPLLSDANSASLGEYYGRITKPVAAFLLAKLAINSQVFADDNWTDGPPNGTTTFPGFASCWDATIAYCDMIESLGYKLEVDYFKNFSVKNETSTENIFVIPMDPVLYKAKMDYRVRTLHYEHGAAFGIGGNNGASATREMNAVLENARTYGDVRFKSFFYDEIILAPSGTPVMNGSVPLQYVPSAISSNVSGRPEEKTAGARWNKYEIDPAALDDGNLNNNDFVLFRFADVLLMRAEASLRGGLGTGQLDFDLVRDRSKSTEVITCTLDAILKERMLEFNWEGLRRQDLIRFDKFHLPIFERPTSSRFRTVFPIHQDVLMLNNNLTQNAGY